MKDKDLGSMSLKVQVKHNDVKAELFVGSVRTLQRLSEALPELAMNLQTEGFNLQEFSLALGHGQRQRQEAHEDQRQTTQTIETVKGISFAHIRPRGLISIKA